MNYKFDDGEKMGGTQNPTWKFDTEGDKISGWLISVKHGVGRNKSNVYTLATDDGDIDIWGSTVLDRHLESLAIRRNALQITYKGEAQGKRGTYHDFEVVVVPTDIKGKQQEGDPILKSVISPEDQAKRERAMEEMENDQDLAERDAPSDEDIPAVEEGVNVDDIPF